MSTLQPTAIESRIGGEDNSESPENNTSQLRKFKKLKPTRSLPLNARTRIRRSARNEETARPQTNKRTGPKTFLFQMIICWLVICIPGNIFFGIIFPKHHIITKEDNVENEYSAYTTNCSTFAYPQNTSLLRDEADEQMKVITLNLCFLSPILFLHLFRFTTCIL